MIKKNNLLKNLLSFLKINLVLLLIYPYRKMQNKKLFNKYYNKNADPLIQEAIQFLTKNGVSMMPFNFTLKFTDQIQVYKDNVSGFPFVKIKTHNVFFPKLSKKKIIKSVNTAIMEQDERSPHKYIPNKKIIKGHTAILIGGSDGIFALEIINYFEHIIIFECDKKWIEPLKLTMQPFENKVTIVNKLVSEISDYNNTTLDLFFKDYNYPIDYMQHDVEGSSISILKGSTSILKENNINISIACYHTQSEAQEIDAFLTKNGYYCTYSEKFMFLWMQKLKDPYIRKGVIYANK